jgi:hypothetical protein
LHQAGSLFCIRDAVHLQARPAKREHGEVSQYGRAIIHLDSLLDDWWLIDP